MVQKEIGNDGIEVPGTLQEFQRVAPLRDRAPPQPRKRPSGSALDNGAAIHNGQAHAATTKPARNCKHQSAVAPAQVGDAQGSSMWQLRWQMKRQMPIELPGDGSSVAHEG